MTSEPIPLRRKTHDLVAELVDLTEQIAELTERAGIVRGLLAAETPGRHDTPAGSFTVKTPSRKFDADRAFASLPEAAQALCLGVVPSKVKAQIPPAALDAFMVAGTGPNTVSLA